MGLLSAIAILGLSGGQPYPIAEVLGAARHACDAALAGGGAAEQLGKAGWTPASVPPGGWIDSSLREEAKMFGPGSPASDVYAGHAAGRDLFAFVKTIAVDGGDLRLCSVQDPSAEIETAPAAILAWAVRPPSSPALVEPRLQQGLDEIVFMKNWQPGLNEGADDTTIRYVPLKYGGSNGGLSFMSERLVRKDVQ